VHHPTALTRANGQPALAFYAWAAEASAYLPFALTVLSFRDCQISDVTAFIVRSTGATNSEAYERFPEQPFNPARLAGAFGRFGLRRTPLTARVPRARFSAPPDVPGYVGE
jgi:hypothetical protein